MSQKERLNSIVHVCYCAIKCQGCADNTRAPQLGEEKRVSNAMLQGIEKWGSMWYNIPLKPAVALLQMIISSATSPYITSR